MFVNYQLAVMIAAFECVVWEFNMPYAVVEGFCVTLRVFVDDQLLH